MITKNIKQCVFSLCAILILVFGVGIGSSYAEEGYNGVDEGESVLIADVNGVSDEGHISDEEHISSGSVEGEEGGHGAFSKTFLWIAIVLIFAKFSGLVERFGQPAVLGELVMGVILGNLVFLGIDFFEPIKHNIIISFLSELGVVILLFQIGLESNISQMHTVGFRAGMVAIVGVVVPFVSGAYIIGPLLLPGLSSNAYLFLGAALTATSVGITARVFKDLGKLKIPEAQIVLGAAVIDDVLGLIILAVVSALATLGAVSVGLVGWIFAKAILFLVGAIVLGSLFAPRISRVFSKINTGVGMKFSIVFGFCLSFAYIAGEIGLAPIVGAFAAGLVLDPVHFKFFSSPDVCENINGALKDARQDTKDRIGKVIDKHSDHHIEHLMEPVAHFLVPIFFIVTGMSVDITTLFDVPILIVALGVTLLAFVSKIVSGLFAGKVNKWLVGFGMVPRGEVGLIFATIGLSLGVISNEVFSIVVIMVILTTLFTPPILTYLLKRNSI